MFQNQTIPCLAYYSAYWSTVEGSQCQPTISLFLEKKIMKVHQLNSTDNSMKLLFRPARSRQWWFHIPATCVLTMGLPLATGPTLLYKVLYQ